MMRILIDLYPLDTPEQSGIRVTVNGEIVLTTYDPDQSEQCIDVVEMYLAQGYQEMGLLDDELE